MCACIILIKLKMNIVVNKLSTTFKVLNRSAKLYQALQKGLERQTISSSQKLFHRQFACKMTNLFRSFMGSQRFVFGYSDKMEMPKHRQHPKMPVHQFLDAHQLAYMEGPNVYKIKYCPFCTKPHHDDRSNLYVLNIHKEYGYYHCFRCSSRGNWLQFRQKVLGIDSEFSAGSFLSENKHNESAGNTNQRISEAEYFFFKENLFNKGFEEVLEYIKSRGFNEQTIKMFNLGAGSEDFYDEEGNAHKINLVYFPLYKIKQGKERKAEVIEDFDSKFDSNFNFLNDWTQIAKVKMRGASKETKKYMRQYPIGSSKGIFGLNLIKDTDKTVVITEGEFDAMAVYQQTGIPSVSLPQGATNLPDALLAYFDCFDKIILWMDNDEAGILNTSKIAEKLGLKRTCIVKHTVPKMKDANDFLKFHPEMIKELVSNAKTIPESNITKFSRLRQIIKAKLLNQELQEGIKVSWLPFFNQKVKGVRLGQLTVVSGPTGSGKTTFLSQLFLDLCQRDIGVLWGSFQIRNEVLITHMLNQFSNINMAKNIQKFDYFAEKFDKLPLYMMNFYGSTTADKILSTIVYSIEKLNIHMVVLDTLQFMLSEQGEGFKKFELQDSLMAKLREISIKFNVHVVIVIHPKKTEEGEDIGIHSIYGTSKATQEADNIWVIQNRDGFKVLQIKKNRYDGELGKIPLGFNRQSKRFFQLKRAEFEAVRTKQMTMRDVIKAREEEEAEKNPVSEEEFHLFEDQIKDHELAKTPKNFNSNYSRGH